MPHYKRQHYLPASYLRYFSIDQDHCTRDSWIWRFDGKVQRPVAVASQCATDYLYSRLKPAETEKMFKSIEDRYCVCVDKMKFGKKPTSSEYGDLLTAMFDLHLRNAVHKNATGKEGIEAYKVRSRVFMSEILLGRKDGNVPEKEIVTHIERCWDIRVVTNKPGHAFLTSDHPSAWITINPLMPALHMVMLPITPTKVAIGYDKRILQIVSDQMNAEDELTLNATQIESAVQCVYASSRLADEQLEIIESHFAQKPPSACEVSEGSWTLKLQRLLPEHYFSFMHLSPPLF